MVRRIEVNQVHDIPVGKLQCRYYQRPIRATWIEIGKHESIGPTGPNLNGQASLNLVLREDQVIVTDAWPESNSIPCPEQHRIVNRVAPISDVEDLDIVAGTARQDIVAAPTGQDIIPGKNRDPIHDIRAGDGIIAVGPC